jgi:glycosyltransferase involved in cell wall biosynthesis
LGNGGAERVCVNMAQSIISLGGEVDFITLYNKEGYIGFEPNHILCLEIKSDSSKLNTIKEILRNKKHINKFINDMEETHKYDLVTAHLPLSHICASVSDKSQKTLYIQHTSLISEGKFLQLYKMFYKSKINICVSEGLRKEFINDMGYSNKSCFTIYNPININDIRNKSDMGKPYDKAYILCVGRLCDAKRFDRAIEIFYKGEFYNNYDLVILGKGELHEKLSNQIKSYGLEDKVILKGWSDNVYAWMKNAELLLQTSDREAFPMVLIEALACGVKVVASDCEYGAEEILLPPLDGFIAKHDDIDDYISKINTALNAYPILESCKILEECSDKVVVNKYFEIYKKTKG